MKARMVWVVLLAAVWQAAAGVNPVDRYNVRWESPSRDHHGSMPLGNGEVAANVWMTAEGELHLYLARTDAWDDYGRLVKVGKVRIRLTPNPVAAGGAFRQELVLSQGAVEVGIGPRAETRLRVWVDAHHPVVSVDIDSVQPIEATATVDLWRTNRQEVSEFQVSDVLNLRKSPDGKPVVMVLEPDTVLADQAGRLVWYHHNTKSVGPALLAEVQGLSGFSQPDPLLHRTFGGMVTARGGQRLTDRELQSPRGKSHRFSIAVLTQHPATPQEWLGSVESVMHRAEAEGHGRRFRAHREWWTAFWDRSWIRAKSREGGVGAGGSIVPRNSLPVLAGVDQAGGNRLVGELGRVSLFTRPLSGAEVKSVAGRGVGAALEPASGLVFSGAPVAAGPLAGLSALDGTAGLTIEAWVKPGALGSGGGRIVDQITPGGSDGFLLDTFPGNSLRFICGERQLQQRDALPAGTWTHVAAVADSRAGGCRLYVNGELVAEDGGVVVADEAHLVSQAYHLQRFITASAGRGAYPIKFNGTLFTVPPGPTEQDPDYRRWGPGYWWQNTRLPYISLCAAGDFDLQGPLFRMYARELLPLCVYRTRHYLGHGGAYYPECIMFWGAVFSESYGWTPFAERTDKLQESRWHKWEWVGGLELSWMMLDYYDHTLDDGFLRETVLPFTREILGFFEQHYPVNAAGQLVFHPSQALETWWHCTNATPEVAGCIAVTERLLGLPGDLVSAAERAHWLRFKAKLPPVPLRRVAGKPALAPAEFFDQKSNIENPELYPVFPFRLYAFNRPNADWAVRALEHRWDRGNSGWRQDDIFMAYLGLASEARQNLVGRARNYDRGERFPAFWGPNFDWTPDQDHGGVLMKAFQAMLLQTDGQQIFLMPAWPADWDVEFKLHAPGRTVLEGSIREGRVRGLRVSPGIRRADVVLCGPAGVGDGR